MSGSGAAAAGAAGELVEPASRPRLLLVEDEPQLAAMLIRLFGEEGYAVDHAADGQGGLHHALTRQYAALVLDCGLPAIDGLDLLGRLRRRGVAVPVLILSARTAVPDRVAGLDAGAEDYLGKPFEVDELLARLRALLRRHADRAEELPVPPGRRLDLPARQVRDATGGVVELSEREARLLSLLASRPTRVFTRAELRRQVFGEADSDNIVDVYVHYLRRKLGRGTVRTVRGVGYQLGR
jgi:two-component system, OmpR family, response regulator QseB